MVKTDARPIRIVLLTRSLELGGAERQIVNLAIGLHRRNVDVRIVSFYRGGVLEREPAAAGIAIDNLDKTGRWESFGFMKRLSDRLSDLEPDIVYSFLEVPNLVSVLARPFAKPYSVVWGVRSSGIGLRASGVIHAAVYAMQSTVSRMADGIIFNSVAGLRNGQDAGLRPDRFTVIPNGIDTEVFRFDADARERHRREWAVSDRNPLVGIVARVHPMKDHQNFLDAAGIVASRRPDVRFVCAGLDTDSKLSEPVARRGLSERVRLLGRSIDSAAIMSALDLNVQSSAFGEGFPNVVAEAMACGIPSVVTDVGDAGMIVGDIGQVVPAKRPDRLAAAIMDQLDRKREPDALRSSIVERFGLARMIDSTYDFLAGVSGDTG